VSEEKPTLEEFIVAELRASYIANVLPAAMPYANCPLCGVNYCGHDDGACDRRMAEWAPSGLQVRR